MSKKRNHKRKYRADDPPEIAKKVYEYIKDNPGTTATMIASALGFKHRNYAYQVIDSFDRYDNLVISQDDNNKFYPFDKHELDDKGWIL